MIMKEIWKSPRPGYDFKSFAETVNPSFSTIIPQHGIAWTPSTMEEDHHNVCFYYSQFLVILIVKLRYVEMDGHHSQGLVSELCTSENQEPQVLMEKWIWTIKPSQDVYYYYIFF